MNVWPVSSSPSRDEYQFILPVNSSLSSSASVAFAVNVTVSPVMKMAPSEGLEMRRFGAVCMMIVTVSELLPPLLSVTLAVIMWEPTARFSRVMVRPSPSLSSSEYHCMRLVRLPSSVSEAVAVNVTFSPDMKVVSVGAVMSMVGGVWLWPPSRCRRAYP